MSNSWSTAGRTSSELHAALCDTKEGDSVSFTDWRGDPDQQLVESTDLAHTLCDLAARGVKVRGLVWRSHSKLAGFHMERHVELAQDVNARGGLVLLDQRVRRAGSHHQKLVLIRHADARRPDVAFVGGIDLCHGRRDDERHLGDVQPEEMDDRYGDHPPWHDIQVCIRGPAVGDLDHTFRERWEDPTPLEEHRTPLRVLVSRWSKQPELRDQLPDQPPDPAPEGSQAVQVLRTYPWKRPAFSFAPEGSGASSAPTAMRSSGHDP